MREKESFRLAHALTLLIGILFFSITCVFVVTSRADVEGKNFSMGVWYTYGPDLERPTVDSDEDFYSVGTPLTIRYGSETKQAESLWRSWIDLDDAFGKGTKSVTILSYPIPLGYEAFLAPDQPLTFRHDGIFSSHHVSYMIPLKKPGEPSDLSQTVVYIRQTSTSEQYTIGKESEFRPSVTVAINMSATLREGTDYYVTYKNTPVSGDTLSVTITVHGMGHYSGTVSKTFSYSPVFESRRTIKTAPSQIKLKVKGKKVTVSWKKLSKNQLKKLNIKNVQVMIGTDKNFSHYSSTRKYLLKIVDAKKTSVKFAGKKKKTYYVKLCYFGNGRYSKWSRVKKIKVK